VISSVFRGKEVTFRNPTNPKAVRDALKDAAENVKARSELALDSVRGLDKKSMQTPADMARTKREAIVKSACQVSTLESLGSMSGTIHDLVGKCGMSVAPVVGYVKHGYDLFTGWAKVADSLHRQYSISDRGYIIDTGSPAAAFEAFGTPGWMDYVENLKKRQFDGTYESATRLIDNSPWEIKGLPKRPAAGAGMNLGRITSPIKELGGNIKGIFG